jgi:hypothetical protein
MSGVGTSQPYTDAPGVAKYKSLMAGGFSQAEADQWATQQTQKLQAGGFKPSEIEAYWGNQPPHNAALAQHVATNYGLAAAEDAKVTTDPLHAFLAGWDVSATGLAVNGTSPKLVTPQSAGLASKVMNASGQFLGDLPFSVAGMFGGATVGAGVGGAGGAAAAAPTGELAAPVTVPVGVAGGAIVGGGFGFGATPEAARQILLDAYAARDGRIKTWQDAVHVVASSLWETTKQGTIGAASNLVGGKVGAKALELGASQYISGGANAAAQVVTATGVGSALDGHVPDAKDFTAAALLAVGMHTAGHFATPKAARDATSRVQSNMENLYRQTGVPPWEAMDRASKDPVFKQELFSQDPNGDPVTPQFRNVAPGDPPPYKPDVASTGLMASHTTAWLQPETMRNVTPKGEKPAGGVTTANNPAHAKELLASLEGSADDAVSPKGAIGKYQIMPATARQYMGKDFDVKTLFDPKVNSAVADRIVADLYKRFNGDMNAIAIAYNAGPGRAGEYMKAGPGTALVAVPDKTMRGGIRYEAEPSRRDESFLPTETQRYLANERRKGGGGEPPGGAGGSGAEPKFPSYEVATTGGGEGGGGGPPSVPGPGEGDGGEPPRKRGDGYEGSWSDEILKNVGEEPARGGISLDRTLGQFVSELTPARRIDDRLIREGELDRNKDMGAEDMFRQTYASDQRAGAFIRYGRVDAIDLKVVKGTPSIMTAVEQAKDGGGTLAEWTAYMLAQRTMEKRKQGIDTGFNPGAAEDGITDAKARQRYEKATATFNEALDGVLQYSRDSGVHSDAQIEAMKRDNPAYISMRRIMGDDESFDGKGRGFQSKDALRRMEGSDRQIVDPIKATLDNIRLIVKMADRNRAIGHIIGLVERGELKDSGLTKIEDQQTIRAADEKVFKPYGLPPESDPNETYAPLLAEKANGKSGPNDFTFYRNGVPETWRASDPALAELMRKADSPGQQNIIMKGFQAFAGLERAGIVVSPDFPTKVQLRHQVTAFIFDPLHPPPFFTWLRGIGDVIGHTDTYKDWVASGGAGVALADMDVNWVQRDMDRVFQDTGTWDGVSNVVKHPIQFAQLISEQLDAAARIGYTKLAADKGIEPVKAATMARKAYLDYSEKATANIANGMASVVPFFRPHLLGMKQAWESFEVNSKGQTVLGRMASTAAYSVAAVTLPVVALYALNLLQDQTLPEERKYANIPYWQKDHYFISPEINGARVRLRLPPNVGFAAGGLVIRMLDWATQQNPHAMEGWAKEFLGEYVPPILPTIAQPPVEVITNHSFFTGKPLIPGSLDKADGYMQYTPATSETGKSLSRALGPPGLNVLDFSPIQFDQYVKGWTGSLGGLALKALDLPYTGGKKPPEIADIPFVGSFFVRNPGLNAQPIQDFYEQAGALEKKSADFALAMKRLEGGGDNTSDVENNATGNAFAQSVAGIKDALGVQSSVIQGISSNKDMTATEKRQAIDALLPQMIDTAKQGVKAIDDMQKQAKEPEQPPLAAGQLAAPPSLDKPAGRAVGGSAPPPAPPPNAGDVPIA